MRVRRASAHARRPSASFLPALPVALVAVALAAPSAGAAGAPLAGVAPTTAAAGAPAGAARSTTGAEVTDMDVPTISRSAAVSTATSLDLTDWQAHRLVAHLRAPSVHDFSMLGVTWDHRAKPATVSVKIRTRSDDGWGAWTALDTDRDGGPVTTANDSAFRDGTEPLWVGDATGVEVVVFGSSGAPSGLNVSTIAPGVPPAGIAAAAKVSASIDPGKPGTFPEMPNVVTRTQWGADESLGDECWDPKYGRTFNAVIVHHSAGSNDYTRAESQAIVRGILAYHTQSRGWCDIGYNFLIDRFGTVFEGRAGGIRQPVRGAHSGDYNVNTTGISLMGNFDVAYATNAMKSTLVRLIAWRLGTAYHGAYGKPFVFDRKISRISGHRDVMSTACPGKHIYDWLPRLRHLVSARLGGYESRIQKAWERRGAKSGALGPVRVGEQAGGHGRHTTFVHGRVYLDASGMHTFYKGPVLKRYIKAGETRGDLSYPRTGVRSVGHGLGYAAEFRGGHIYWSKSTGGQVLRRGVVLKKYISLKAAVGRLGFPTTGVVDLRHGARARFEHGSITYDKLTHRTTVRYR